MMFPSITFLVLISSPLIVNSYPSSSSSNDLNNEIDPNYSPSSNPPAQADWLRMPPLLPPHLATPMGSHVELECEAIGSPPPQIQWYKDKQQLTFANQAEQEQSSSVESNQIKSYLAETTDFHHHRRQADNKPLAKIRSRLVINYVLPVHEGRFSCVAQSGDKIQSKHTRLTMKRTQKSVFSMEKLLGHYAPRISLWAANYLDVIGKNVVLPCRAFGNPRPQITWQLENGAEIASDEYEEQEDAGTQRVRVLPDGDLSIKQLNWDDMGVYKCVAKNMAGVDEVETFLYPMKASDNNDDE